MKKYLLSAIALAALTSQAFAQPTFKVLAPASIAGNYTFSWAEWSQTPDFNTAGVFVEDTLAFVDDGTPGENAQGNPLAQEGCNQLINPNDVNTQIGVSYRGTCQFGTKALNAQNAGAVALIIINRDPETIAMGEGTDGPNVTIPVVMITSIDGVTVKDEMGNGDVVAFIGNKQGLNANDMSATADQALIKPFATSHSSLTNSFNPTINVRNVGNQDQTDVTVTCTIDGPAGNVYTESVGPLTVAAGGEVYIVNGNPNSFPDFDLGTYPVGDYNMSYSIDLGANTDEDPSDNLLESTFTINAEYLSKAGWDNGAPISTSYPSNSETVYTSCVTFRDANASVQPLTGYMFSPDADTTGGGDISGEEVFLRILEQSDSSVLDATSLTEVFSEPTFLSSNADIRQTLTVDLQTPFTFFDNQLYLVCLETQNGTIVSFGYDGGINYDGNFAVTGIFQAPVQVDQGGNVQYYSGWTGTNAPSLAMRLGGASLDEVADVQIGAFPNPTSDNVSIRTSFEGNANIVVTDLNGRIVMNEEVVLAGGGVNLNVAHLDAGMYVFNVALDNGQTSRLNVVKK